MVKYKNIYLHFLILSTVYIIGHITPLINVAYPADINFEVTVDKAKVQIGESIQLSLTFHGTQDVSAPRLPKIDGFEAQYIGPSTMMSIVNGRVSTSITHNYRLIPLKVGTFQIGPFQLQYRGKRYTSKPITVEVVKQLSGRIPAPGTTMPYQLNLEDRVFLVLQTQKQKAFINEIIPVKIKLYINRLSIRDIQYPEFGHEGFSMSEFEKPRRYTEVLGGLVYDVIEFDTTIFATRSGELQLGPARLKCNLIVKKRSRRGPSSIFDDFFGEDIFEDFFGRYETYPLQLKSVKIPITILPLPEEGRPDDFSGAIGDFRFTLKAEPRQVKVGDPITLKMIIEGRGNFNTVSAPKLKDTSGFKVYEPQVTKKEGIKIFEQVIIPTNEKIKQIPQMSFSFFDPKTGQYHTITKGPVSISISSPEKKEEFKIVESPRLPVEPFKREVLGKDIIYIKETPGAFKRLDSYFYKDRRYLLFHIFPIFLYISVILIKRRRYRLKTDQRYARLIRASKKARGFIQDAKRLMPSKKADEFYDILYKTLKEFIADKFNLPSGGLTSSVIDEVLRPAGIPEDTLRDIKELFNVCDMARFAPGEIGRTKMEEDLRKCIGIIGFLEKHRL